MSTTPDNLAKLRLPFDPKDIEWRVQQAGTKNTNITTGEVKQWASVIAYIDNRAIMRRLDAVVGPQNWRNEFSEAPGGDGGVICGIGICVDDAWVTKWDGAERTNIEPVKGGLSNSMKRAAVQWGIGRYLYKLERGFVEVLSTTEMASKGNREGYVKLWQKADPKTKRPSVEGWWTPPTLPSWARPTQSSKELDRND